MRALATAGAGVIGSHLVDALLDGATDGAGSVAMVNCRHVDVELLLGRERELQRLWGSGGQRRREAGGRTRSAVSSDTST